MYLFVHNLSAQATESDVQDAFGVFGMVKATAIMKHKSSGKPRGFCFVVMPSDEEAQAALHGMAGTEFLGRILTVREANLHSELRSGVCQEERGSPMSKLSLLPFKDELEVGGRVRVQQGRRSLPELLVGKVGTVVELFRVPRGSCLVRIDGDQNRRQEWFFYDDEVAASNT